MQGVGGTFLREARKWVSDCSQILINVKEIEWGYGEGYATAAAKMAEIARQTQFLDSSFYFSFFFLLFFFFSSVGKMKTKRVCAGLGNIILDLDLMAVSKLANALRNRGAVGDSENCWAKMDIVLIFSNWGLNIVTRIDRPQAGGLAGRFVCRIFDQEFKL